MKKIKKILYELLDIACFVLPVVSGALHFSETGDWCWILWTCLVLALEWLIYLYQRLVERKTREADTWRWLYEGKCEEVLTVIKQAEALREKVSWGNEE